MTLASALLPLLAALGLAHASAEYADLGSADPVDELVRFEGAGGFALRGTFTRPAELAESGFPGVLLLQDAGPLDRDGNRGDFQRTDLGTELALLLAREGVASLRFDKRTSDAYLLATGYASLAEKRALCAWPNLVEDAHRALDVLAARADVDAQRLAIAAHGGGGYLALTLAAERAGVGAGPRTDARAGVQALILANVPAAGWREVLRNQVGTAAGPPDSSERELALAELDRAVDAIVAGRPLPGDLEPFTRLLFHETDLDHLNVQLAFDPLPLARAFSGSVLVLTGESDQVVPPEHGPRLARAFAHATYASSESTSHALKPFEPPAHDGFSGSLAPAARTALVVWMRSAWLAPESR